MPSKPRALGFLSVLVALTNAPAQDAVATLRAKLDAFVQPLIDAEIIVGCVVGAIDGDTEVVQGYGRVARGGEAVPDGSTLYEIGSVSKIFTGLLLADAVERGLCSLDDAVQKHLPEGVTLRPWGGHDVLLWHLATHSSGLPRMPRDEAPDPNNPFAHYDVEAMHAAIDDARARRAPGSTYEYSNLGAGILGYVLMRMNGCSSYDELLDRRITAPLAMEDTAVVLSASQQASFAPPYDADLAPASAWDLAMMAGAGGIRSTVPDLLKFARLQIEPGGSPLAAAMRLSQQRRHDGQNGIAVALGWHIARDGKSLVHTGATGGYHAYFGIVPSTRRAVCVLTNTATGLVDAVAEKLLVALHGRDVTPPVFEKPIAVERSKLEPLVGKYRLMPGLEFDVTLEGDVVRAQLTGQPSWRLYPRSPTEFFYRVVDASVTFEFDGDAVKQLVLHQNGRDMSYRRVDDRGD